MEANADPTTVSICKGHWSGVSAFGQACQVGHQKIVNLFLEPRHGVERKGSVYDDVALRAARGRYDRSHSYAEILKLLLAKGEFTNLRKLQREIIGESCYWGKEDVLRLVLEDFPSVRFPWRCAQTPIDVAIARKDETIVQILLAHEVGQSQAK
jgi:hypothetical protein